MEKTSLERILTKIKSRFQLKEFLQYTGISLFNLKDSTFLISQSSTQNFSINFQKKRKK